MVIATVFNEYTIRLIDIVMWIIRIASAVDQYKLEWLVRQSGSVLVFAVNTSKKKTISCENCKNKIEQ